MRVTFGHRLANSVELVALLAALAAIAGVVGYVFAGPPGVWFTLVGGVVIAVAALAGAPALVLAQRGARLLNAGNAPGVVDILETLCRRAGIGEAPRLVYLPDQQPNAFAAGSVGTSIIAVTDGLLRLLDRRELAGVLAHEVAHIANNDVMVMTLADLFRRFISLISRIGLFVALLAIPAWILYDPGIVIGLAPVLWLLVLAPFASLVVQFALSRNREFDADMTAVRLAGDNVGLINALGKLEYRNRFFENFFRLGGRAREPWLQSHPPVEERVRRLRSYGPDRLRYFP